MLIFNWIVVVWFVAQRLVELIISNRHVALLHRAGARAVPDPVFPWMVITHVLLIAGCALEPWLLDRPFIPWLGFTALGMLVLAQVGRFWVLRTMGRHWTVRVVASAAKGVVADGPYRHVRHPNYVVVIVETVCLPLFHGSWWTLLAVQLLHLPVLFLRIRSEERYLMSVAEYRARMGFKPRFVPRLRRREASS